MEVINEHESTTEPAAAAASTVLVTDWLNKSNFDECKSSSTPEKEKWPKKEVSSDPLPTNWAHSKDDDGFVYYFNTISRKTQWSPPPVDDKASKSSLSTIEQVTLTKDLKFMSAKEKEDFEKKKAIAAFKELLSRQIKSDLEIYRKPECKVGRITCVKHFRTAARKITEALTMKELKAVHWKDLEYNKEVTKKVSTYITRYMAAQPAVFAPRCSSSKNNSSAASGTSKQK